MYYYSTEIYITSDIGWEPPTKNLYTIKLDIGLSLSDDLNDSL